MNTIQNLENSVYKINTAFGSGTGFYSTQDNVIITNFHVVSGSLSVSIEDGLKNRYLAKVIYANPGKDIAFLKVESLPIPIQTVTTIHATTVSTRDKLLVLGFPYGMPYTVTEGTVSNPKQAIGSSDYIQTDAAINPGNSGGPVINEKGELLGIVTAKFSDADNMGFAIPIETIREELDIIDQLLDELTIGCPSCNSLIQEKTSYCPNCGNDIEESLFQESLPSDFSVKVEKAIQNLGIDPVLARTGSEYWKFHLGSAEIRMFVYDNNYLFATSPLNELPRKNLAEIYEYIMRTDTGEHRLSISDNQVFLSYRVHISDLYSNYEDQVIKSLAQLAEKADELDNRFVGDFGANMSKFSKHHEA
ncbi:trypsin-like peptidase domain-containing protein [Algoriphagus halophytocola]|uniref:Trypsin-like peptidase domain-containing protein n=1 Tax=Algoriphagus halophytocola TaxID=2991499 RepID=A0ABY6MHH9_9BACT|nr:MULTISPECIES: trypsin-like peptidase domain-containing protein [unclassified Algoriphagus]UZD22939.1 trypsin-like peptidase domain-containing protein [Algoriphagus sp. TR-M5]WBL44208.1 trypsin-like peptidase domain-containing protein [Algoriphagus sp. TR-M9]